MKTSHDQRKYILFPADIGTHWIGGLYYFKNIVYSFLQNKSIINQYRVLIVTTKECFDVFQCFSDSCEIYVHQCNSKIGIQLEYIGIFARYPVAFMYYGTRIIPILRYGVKAIHWIPDFQHVHYPEFFTEAVKKDRNNRFTMLANSKEPVVLSSESAKNDFVQYFHGKDQFIHVVPFVSYIEQEVYALTPELECSVLEKHGLKPRNYIYIPNQFWKHKNHMVVLQTVTLLGDEIGDMQFVFTGNMNCYKDDGYLDGLNRMLEDPSVSVHCKMVGFLDRMAQLTIMKNSLFIIQPSLFEGWSTVVEDAKVLDKTLVLSNIDVHKEQRYEKCHYFDPHKPEELKEVVLQLLHTPKEQLADDVQLGLDRMKRDAKKYAERLEFIVET